MRLGSGPVPEPPHVAVLVGEEAVRVVAAVFVVAEATAEDGSRLAPRQRAAEAAHHLLLCAHVARASAAHLAFLDPQTEGRPARDCGRPSGFPERDVEARQAGKRAGRGAQRKAQRKARMRGEDGAPGDPVDRCAGAEAGERAGTQFEERPAPAPLPRNTTPGLGRQGEHLRTSPARGNTVPGRQDPSRGDCVLHRRQADGVLWGIHYSI